jgi:hypothetical protein
MKNGQQCSSSLIDCGSPTYDLMREFCENLNCTQCAASSENLTCISRTVPQWIIIHFIISGLFFFLGIGFVLSFSLTIWSGSLKYVEHFSVILGILGLLNLVALGFYLMMNAANSLGSASVPSCSNGGGDFVVDCYPLVVATSLTALCKNTNNCTTCLNLENGECFEKSRVEIGTEIGFLILGIFILCCSCSVIWRFDDLTRSPIHQEEISLSNR